MNKCKTAIKIISFILIMTVIFASVDGILKVKYVDGIYSMKRFYELEDDSVDVLFLGSSHVFETYNTSVCSGWFCPAYVEYILLYEGSLENTNT